MRIQGRSILGYFTSADEAQSAAQALREKGFDSVSIDRVSAHQGEATQALRNPLTGRISGLGELTLGAGTEPDESAALAASPAASGLAEDTGLKGLAYLVTTVVSDGRDDEAVEVYREHGAYM